jgi:hypothetical protein
MAVALVLHPQQRVFNITVIKLQRSSAFCATPNNVYVKDEAI